MVLAYKYFDLGRRFHGLNGEWALFVGPVLVVALLGRNGNKSSVGFDAIDSGRWIRRAGVAGLLAGSALAFESAYFVRELSNPVQTAKVVTTVAATLAVIVGASMCVFRHPTRGVWLMLVGCLTTAGLLASAFLKHNNPAALVLGTSLIPVTVLAVRAATKASRHSRQNLAPTT